MEKREELLKKLPRCANVQELYLLQKYEKKVNQMAALAGNRTKYREMVGILRSMKKIRGGSKAVERIVEDWKRRFRLMKIR